MSCLQTKKSVEGVIWPSAKQPHVVEFKTPILRISVIDWGRESVAITRCGRDGA